MRELSCLTFHMFVPEYTITPLILANIATIEYGKAIVDTTKILPSWRKQLQKEASVKTLFSSAY